MSDVEVLLAEGYSVKLADGSERNLQFRNEQVLTLEKRYGGLRGFMQALRQNTLETTAWTFSLLFSTSPQRALSLVDARQMGKYVVAITDSLVEFFGLDIPRCAVCDQGLPSEAKFCPNCGTAAPDSGEASAQETESGLFPGRDSSTQPLPSSESNQATSGMT